VVDYKVRNECPSDYDEISDVVAQSFLEAEFSSGIEAHTVLALRANSCLAISMVAEMDGEVVGYIAASPVLINKVDYGWYGLGPISVLPEYQNRGIGQQLIHEAVEKLKLKGAKGCVVIGDPCYYKRFGFKHVSCMRIAGANEEKFLVRSFLGALPTGFVTYNPVFSQV